MGKQYASLTDTDIEFINNQKLFYIASCAKNEVNLSPRGYDSIHIIDNNTFYMMDMYGSGNRTARDIRDDGEITLVFNAFEGSPKILRCFCKGEVISKDSKEFKNISIHFNESVDVIRQFLKFKIYAVETSCGMGVPVMEFKEQREHLRKSLAKIYKNDNLDEFVKKYESPASLKF